MQTKKLVFVSLVAQKIFKYAFHFWIEWSTFNNNNKPKLTGLLNKLQGEKRILHVLLYCYEYDKYIIASLRNVTWWM